MLLHQMVFATARLHIQLMQWEEPAIIERSLAECDQLFERIPQHLVRTSIRVVLNIFLMCPFSVS